MQTAKRPPGRGGRCSTDIPKIDTGISKPQASHPQPEIFIEHSPHAAISVALSRDRGRVTITTFARIDGAWRQVGQAASLPAILIDSAIDALQALRDRMARESAE